MCHEALAGLVHQGHHGVFAYMLVVELSVYVEHLFVEFLHGLLMILAEGFRLRYHEVEVLADVQCREFVLEGGQVHSHVADKEEGLSLGGLLQQFFLSLSDGVELVGYGHILVVFFFHCCYRVSVICQS